MRRLRCCGLDVSWLPKLLPCVSFVPPEWWYRYSRRQRKIMLTVGTVGGILIAVAVALTVRPSPPSIPCQFDNARL